MQLAVNDYKRDSFSFKKNVLGNEFIFCFKLKLIDQLEYNDNQNLFQRHVC
jgi:hypothetical protein